MEIAFAVLDCAALDLLCQGATGRNLLKPRFPSSIQQPPYGQNVRVIGPVSFNFGNLDEELSPQVLRLFQAGDTLQGRVR